MRVEPSQAASKSLQDVIKTVLLAIAGCGLVFAVAGLALSLAGVDVERYVSAAQVGIVFGSLLGLLAITGLAIRFTGLLAIANDIRVGWPAIPCIAAWISAFWRGYVVGALFGKHGGPQVIDGATFLISPAGTRPISVTEYHQYNALDWSGTFAFATALFLTLVMMCQSLSPVAVRTDDSSPAETL
jgi:hypothetical protein